MDNALVLEIAKTSSCDMDGDIIFIDGKKYYIHILQNIVEDLSDIQVDEVIRKGK